MAVHDMKLDTRSFDRIRSGIKTLELRINDEKRRRVKIADTIKLRKLPELKEEQNVTVLSLHIYPSFAELFENVPLEWLGYTQADKSWLNDSMYTIYSREEEAQFGVVGIRFQVVG